MWTVTMASIVRLFVTGTLLVINAGALAISLNIASVLNAFQNEATSGHQHELIVLGDVTWDKDTIAKATLLGGHQIMVRRVEDSVLNHFIHTEVTLRASRSTASVLIAPPSVQLMLELLANISTYLKTVPIPVVVTRRVFFLCWPEEAKDAGSVEAALLRGEPRVINALKRIRQFQEIYIPIWQSRNGVHEIGELVEVYSSRGQIPVVQRISQAAGRGGLHLEALLPIATRRQDFRGARMTVLGQPDDAFQGELTVRVFPNGTVKFVTGMVFNILQDFMFAMNFTYTAIKGNGWIGLNENKTGLTGLGGQIIRREADLSISLGEFEEYRARFLRYLQPIKAYPPYIHFIQPAIYASQSLFLAPFSTSVWLAMGATWLTLAICGCVIMYKPRRTLGHPGTAAMFLKYCAKSQHTDYFEFWLWSVGIICQIGTEMKPHGLPVRLLCISSMLFGILTYAFYTSIVVASTSIPQKLVRTVRDLERQNFEILVDPSEPSAINGFGFGEAEAARIMQRSEKEFVSPTKAIKAVLTKPQVALITGAVDFHAAGCSMEYSTADMCRVDRLRAGESETKKEAMVMRKTGSFREFFAYQTVVLIERGLADRYGKRFDANVGIFCESPVIPEYELGFDETQGVFLVLFGGYVLSAVIICIEKVVSRRRGPLRCATNGPGFFPSRSFKVVLS